MTIRVVLADDQALIRSGFRVLIDSAEDLEVVGEAATGDDASRVQRAPMSCSWTSACPGRTASPRRGRSPTTTTWRA
jgi:hypothetical protein